MYAYYTYCTYVLQVCNTLNNINESNDSCGDDNGKLPLSIEVDNYTMFIDLCENNLTVGSEQNINKTTLEFILKQIIFLEKYHQILLILN